MLTSVEGPQKEDGTDGTQITYSYDSLKQLTGVSAANGSQTVQNRYGYDAAGRLTQITHNGFNYTIDHDGYGNATIFNAGSRNLLTKIFASGNGNLLSLKYKNNSGDFVWGYNYDSQDRVTSVTKNGATAYLYLYDARGNLAKVTDQTVYGGLTTTYSYDPSNYLIKRESSSGDTIEYSYDDKNRPNGESYVFDDQNVSTGYTYGNDNLKGVTNLSTGDVVSHAYDSLNREIETSIHSPAPLMPYLTAQRTYVSVPDSSNNRTSSLIADYTNATAPSDGGTATELSQYNYTYDNNENIRTVTDQDGNETRYTYDQLNQLVRVDDQKNSVSTTYSYDGGGNITGTSSHAYTTGTLGASTGSTSYAYGDSDWKDLLTGYNGQGITYDGIGNPLTYRNGMSFTWEGRELVSAVANNHHASYTYDDSGIRTQKVVDGTITDYFTENGRILAQRSGDDVMWFQYDSDGTPVGFTSGDDAYYYTKNAQGDITGIAGVDNGEYRLLVEYDYDVWGKLLSTTGEKADTLGVQNPFRYRSYYYDNETGLYYLNSRYYDPQTGRFISADDAETLQSSQGDVLGTNLFAYCENNPVMNSDPDGYLSIPAWIVGTSLDVLFLALNSAMMAGYLSFSGTIYALARNPFTKKLAINLITDKVIPVFVRGFYNPALTLMRKVMWRIAGVTFQLGKGKGIDFLVNSLKNGAMNHLASFVTSMLSWGGIISMAFDMADGNWDGYVTV
ncbi:RHS repeat-associated core domain-containing protein [Caproicibacter sp. BJN0012]|uniref:RHS repeat-associated core domain-containing protein n=1 Tax=Caproicibacter sp. BJN0012 TaxID=3110227 RepID=UPI002E0DC663